MVCESSVSFETEVSQQGVWPVNPLGYVCSLHIEGRGTLLRTIELLTSLAAEWYDVRLVVALVKQGSALLTRGWVTARLISRWHLSGLVAVASNACEVTLWIDFHGRGLNET